MYRLSDALVLIVDDDPTFRTFAELVLKRKGYPVIVQGSGTAARDCIAEHGAAAFACVVTDNCMPDMDGLALIKWIRQQDPTLASILVTAEGEKGIVQKSMRTGALEYLDKPLGVAELHLAVARAIAVTAQRRSAAILRDGAEEAGRIQRQMLQSAQKAGGIGIDLCFHPKFDAGGDFLIHQRYTGNRDVILLTDVAGHSLASAYLSANFAGFAHALLEESVPVEQLFDRYNRFLLNRSSLDTGLLSIAVTALQLDPDKGLITAYTCGAPAPAWFDSSGWLATIWDDRSSPLGWFEERSFAQTSAELTSSPIWIWTDGLDALAIDLAISPFSLSHALLRATAAGTRPAWLSQAQDDLLLARIWPDNISEHQRLEAFEPLLAEIYTPQQAAEIGTLQTRWDNSLAFALPELSSSVRSAILSSARHSVSAILSREQHDRCSVLLQIGFEPTSQQLRVRVASRLLDTACEAEQPTCVSLSEELDARFDFALICQ